MTKQKALFRTVLNGIKGITAELAVVAAFLAAGFLVCLLWWGVFR